VYRDSLYCSYVVQGSCISTALTCSSHQLTRRSQVQLFKINHPYFFSEPLGFFSLQGFFLTLVYIVFCPFSFLEFYPILILKCYGICCCGLFPYIKNSSLVLLIFNNEILVQGSIQRMPIWTIPATPTVRQSNWQTTLWRWQLAVIETIDNTFEVKINNYWNSYWKNRQFFGGDN
jgi:hypothetical protein